MAAWRKKAYALFGFEPGEYSFAQGKVDLFADLVAMAETAIAQDDEEMLDRITEYVCWAANQTADDVASAVDLAFFLPAFRSPALLSEIRRRVPESLFLEKRGLLIEQAPNGE